MESVGYNLNQVFVAYIALYSDHQLYQRYTKRSLLHCIHLYFDYYDWILLVPKKTLQSDNA